MADETKTQAAQKELDENLANGSITAREVRNFSNGVNQVQHFIFTASNGLKRLLVKTTFSTGGRSQIGAVNNWFEE